MKKLDNKILIFGIGNSGRRDDGLGWAFLDEIKRELPDYYDYEYRYQLHVEDAELASQYKKIIFIDAHKQKSEKGYFWSQIYPKVTKSFTSHELDPETVIYLTESIFNCKSKAFLLGISGEDFKLKIGLSKEAKRNLSLALKFFRKTLL